jgi:hypothetical protein
MISLRDFLDLDILCILIFAFCLWGDKVISGFNNKHKKYLMVFGLILLIIETIREIWMMHHIHQIHQYHYTSTAVA